MQIFNCICIGEYRVWEHCSTAMATLLKRAHQLPSAGERYSHKVYCDIYSVNIVCVQEMIYDNSKQTSMYYTYLPVLQIS